QGRGGRDRGRSSRTGDRSGARTRTGTSDRWGLGQASNLDRHQRPAVLRRNDMPVVTQSWTHELPMMQQTVLLTAVRGPDGSPKYGAVKMLMRWFRRCTLLSAIDGKALTTPWDNNGGSFTGPS